MTNQKNVILFVAILHILWGVLILNYGNNLHTTALHQMSLLFGSHYLVALVLFFASILAFYGIITKKDAVATILFIPQNFLLSISFLSVVLAVYQSHYGDGVPRPFQFILSDQLIVIMVFLIYTYYFVKNGVLFIKNKKWIQQ